MLYFLMLSVAVHGVTENIPDFVYLNNIFVSSSSKCSQINVIKECGRVKIISETLINVVHFALSIVLRYHSIPKIN